MTEYDPVLVNALSPKQSLILAWEEKTNLPNGCQSSSMYSYLFISFSKSPDLNSYLASHNI